MLLNSQMFITFKSKDRKKVCDLLWKKYSLCFLWKCEVKTYTFFKF